VDDGTKMMAEQTPQKIKTKTQKIMPKDDLIQKAKKKFNSIFFHPILIILHT
jgi:hypothetical protein